VLILIRKFNISHFLSHSISSAFRTKILNTKLGERSPCNNVGNISFLHIKDSDLYYLAVTRQNANAALLFELLHKLVDVFKAYFNNKVDEESIKENFSVIYELLDGK
jgi:AP-2 complex subunit mu-1